jgi:uncharacterized membrane protein YbhN (UPF0104 family)
MLGVTMTSAPRSEDAPEHEPELSPLDGYKGRSTVIALLVAVLLAVGVWALIGQSANFSRIGRAASRLGPGWLTVSVAGALAGYLGYALLFKAMVDGETGPRLRVNLLLRLTVVVFGASVIATSAGRLGSEYWSLRKLRQDPPSAWSTVLALNTALWALLALLAWFGSVVLLIRPVQGIPSWLVFTWVAALPGLCLPAIYLTSRGRRRWASDTGGRLRRALAAALRGIILIRTVLGQPRRGSALLVGGLVLWGGELITVWAALRAFDYQIGYGPLALAYATGYVSTTLPLPAGGAGGVDAAFAYALNLVGVPMAPALLAVLIQRLCTYWLPLVIALLGARSVKRLGPDLTACSMAAPT